MTASKQSQDGTALQLTCAVSSMCISLKLTVRVLGEWFSYPTWKMRNLNFELSNCHCGY